jgi:hypothetical protein
VQIGEGEREEEEEEEKGGKKKKKKRELDTYVGKRPDEESGDGKRCGSGSGSRGKNK